MKKFFSVFVTLIILFLPFTVSAEGSASSKLLQMEQNTYGEEQNGSILDRINRLEKEYIGQNMRGNMNVRIDSLYDILYNNSGEPSIFAKLNAIEWNAFHEVTSDIVVRRLEKLENGIIGKVTGGNTLKKRVDNLAQASFGSDTIPMAEMQIPENTLIKVILTQSVASRTLQVGDTVDIKVAEDVFVDGNLIFSKGLRGKGTVESVRKAKHLNNGKIVINFYKLDCIDGKSVEIYVGQEAKNAMERYEMIQGASLVGMNIKDDWNKLMVHGKNVAISAGTELYVQTKNTLEMYGLQVKSDNF